MRYSLSSLVVLCVAISFCVVRVEAQECDVAQLVIDNPGSYTGWMLGHAEKPDASSSATIVGRVAEGETILITAAIEAVGDMFFAATANCQIPELSNLGIFDLQATSDYGDDRSLMEIELGPLTEEMFGYYMMGSVEGAVVEEKFIVAVIPDNTLGGLAKMQNADGRAIRPSAFLFKWLNLRCPSDDVG